MPVSYRPFASHDAVRLKISFTKLPICVAVRRTYFDGMTYDYISEIELVSIATLASRVRRALLKFQLALTFPTNLVTAIV